MAAERSEFENEVRELVSRVLSAELDGPPISGETRISAACHDVSTARSSREHNRANVLMLGAGLTGPGLAWPIVPERLSTPWSGDRHLCCESVEGRR